MELLPLIQKEAMKSPLLKAHGPGASRAAQLPEQVQLSVPVQPLGDSEGNPFPRPQERAQGAAGEGTAREGTHRTGVAALPLDGNQVLEGLSRAATGSPAPSQPPTVLVPGSHSAPILVPGPLASSPGTSVPPPNSVQPAHSVCVLDRLPWTPSRAAVCTWPRGTAHSGAAGREPLTGQGREPKPVAARGGGGLPAAVSRPHQGLTQE